MKIIKTDTFLKPLPDNNWYMEDEGTRYVISPVSGSQGIPNGTKFLFRPRSYVFGVFAGQDSWFTLKYDKSGEDIVFDLPGELILSPKEYSVFLGYSDGFLGGSFTPGYYNLKEKVQYWYCVAQTNSDYPIEKYFLTENHPKSPMIIDLSSILLTPNSIDWRLYKIGDPIKIGRVGLRIGDKYDE